MEQFQPMNKKFCLKTLLEKSAMFELGFGLCDVDVWCSSPSLVLKPNWYSMWAMILKNLCEISFRKVVQHVNDFKLAAVHQLFLTFPKPVDLYRTCWSASLLIFRPCAEHRKCRMWEYRMHANQYISALKFLSRFSLAFEKYFIKPAISFPFHWFINTTSVWFLIAQCYDRFLSFSVYFTSLFDVLRRPPASHVVFATLSDASKKSSANALRLSIDRKFPMFNLFSAQFGSFGVEFFFSVECL